jgi:hypothetical protein
MPRIPKVATVSLEAAYEAFQVAETVLAHHEAGHAVVGLALGYPPLSATVCLKPGRPAIGLVTSAGTRPQSVLDSCCILLAGYYAQTRHLGDRNVPGFSADEIEVQCASDFAKVDEVLESFDFVNALTFEVLIGETRKLVEENWPRIERLAAKLLEHGTLDAEQINEAA